MLLFFLLFKRKKVFIMKKDNKSAGGMGFCAVLTLIFIVLRLLKVISWSWVWILSPIWIPLLALLVFIVVFIAVGLLFSKK